MDEGRTRQQIRGFILKHFPLARGRNIKNDDHLLEQGVIDSLGVLDIVAHLEQEFKIVVNDEDLSPDNFRSIDQLTAFVLTKSDSGGE